MLPVDSLHRTAQLGKCEGRPRRWGAAEAVTSRPNWPHQLRVQGGRISLGLSRLAQLGPGPSSLSESATQNGNDSLELLSAIRQAVEIGDYCLHPSKTSLYGAYAQGPPLNSLQSAGTDDLVASWRLGVTDTSQAGSSSSHMTMQRNAFSATMQTAAYQQRADVRSGSTTAVHASPHACSTLKHGAPGPHTSHQAWKSTCWISTIEPNHAHEQHGGHHSHTQPGHDGAADAGAHIGGAMQPLSSSLSLWLDTSQLASLQAWLDTPLTSHQLLLPLMRVDAHGQAGQHAHAPLHHQDAAVQVAEEGHTLEPLSHKAAGPAAPRALEAITHLVRDVSQSQAIAMEQVDMPALSHLQSGTFGLLSASQVQGGHAGQWDNVPNLLPKPYRNFALRGLPKPATARHLSPSQQAVQSGSFFSMQGASAPAAAPMIPTVPANSNVFKGPEQARMLTARITQAGSMQALEALVDDSLQDMDHIHVSALLVRMAKMHRAGVFTEARTGSLNHERAASGASTLGKVNRLQQAAAAKAKAQLPTQAAAVHMTPKAVDSSSSTSSDGDTAVPAWKMLLLDVLAEVPRVMSLLGHRQASNMLWALGVLGGPRGHPMVKALTAKMRQFWGEANGTSIANALWGMARLDQRPSPSWLAEFDKHTPSLLVSFSAQELSNTLWALAALRCRPSATWLQSMQRAIPLVFQDTRDATANAQSSSCMLWSCVQLHVQLGTSARVALSNTLQQSFALAAQANSSSWLSQSSSNGSTMHMPAHRTRPECVQPRPDAHAAAISLWSLARLQLRPGPSLVHTLLQGVQKGLPTCTSQAVSNALWALAQLGHAPPRPWLQACMDCLLRHAQCGSLSQQDLVIGVHAAAQLARLCCVDAAAGRSVETPAAGLALTVQQLAAASSSLLRSLPISTLCTLLHALASAGWRVGGAFASTALRVAYQHLGSASGLDVATLAMAVPQALQPIPGTSWIRRYSKRVEHLLSLPASDPLAMDGQHHAHALRGICIWTSHHLATPTAVSAAAGKVHQKRKQPVAGKSTKRSAFAPSVIPFAALGNAAAAVALPAASLVTALVEGMLQRVDGMMGEDVAEALWALAGLQTQVQALNNASKASAQLAASKVAAPLRALPRTTLLTSPAQKVLLQRFSYVSMRRVLSGAAICKLLAACDHLHIMPPAYWLTGWVDELVSVPAGAAAVQPGAAKVQQSADQSAPACKLLQLPAEALAVLLQCMQQLQRTAGKVVQPKEQQDAAAAFQVVPPALTTLYEHAAASVKVAAPAYADSLARALLLTDVQQPSTVLLLAMEERSQLLLLESAVSCTASLKQHDTGMKGKKSSGVETGKQSRQQQPHPKQHPKQHQQQIALAVPASAASSAAVTMLSCFQRAGYRPSQTWADAWYAATQPQLASLQSPELHALLLLALHMGRQAPQAWLKASASLLTRRVTELGMGEVQAALPVMCALDRLAQLASTPALPLAPELTHPKVADLSPKRPGTMAATATAEEIHDQVQAYKGRDENAAHAGTPAPARHRVLASRRRKAVSLPSYMLHGMRAIMAKRPQEKALAQVSNGNGNAVVSQQVAGTDADASSACSRSVLLQPLAAACSKCLSAEMQSLKAKHPTGSALLQLQLLHSVAVELQGLQPQRSAWAFTILHNLHGALLMQGADACLAQLMTPSGSMQPGAHAATQQSEASAEGLCYLMTSLHAWGCAQQHQAALQEWLHVLAAHLAHWDASLAVRGADWQAEHALKLLTGLAHLRYAPVQQQAEQLQLALAPALLLSQNAVQSAQKPLRRAHAELCMQASAAWSSMGVAPSRAWWVMVESSLPAKALQTLPAHQLSGLVLQLASQHMQPSAYHPTPSWLSGLLAHLARSTTHQQQLVAAALFAHCTTGQPLSAGSATADTDDEAAGRDVGVAVARLVWAVGSLAEECNDAATAAAQAEEEGNASSLQSAGLKADTSNTQPAKRVVVPKRLARDLCSISSELLQQSSSLIHGSVLTPSLEPPALVLLMEGMARVAATADVPEEWSHACSACVEQAARHARSEELCSMLVCMVALRVPVPSPVWLQSCLSALLRAAPAMAASSGGQGLSRLRDVLWAVRALDSTLVTSGETAEAFASALSQLLSPAAGRAAQGGHIGRYGAGGEHLEHAQVGSAGAGAGVGVGACAGGRAAQSQGGKRWVAASRLKLRQPAGQHQYRGAPVARASST